MALQRLAVRPVSVGCAAAFKIVRQTSVLHLFNNLLFILSLHGTHSVGVNSGLVILGKWLSSMSNSSRLWPASPSA